ncbi:MAG TPA: FMN-binding protein [Jatrophihabitans sp.]|jgi:uncharacterized protein with FMN-binding domain|uniref:FMN-binding protein n=1 Tax=Jatrophihabitans sp. TaxID=1932789 RepID=UPI002E03BE1B|nr:FMN-binding protein [Jatrophihabitans sp.]
MKRVLVTITGTVFGVVALLSFKTQGHPRAFAGALPSAAAPTSPAGAPATTSGGGGSTPPDPRSSSAAATGAKKRYVGSAIETPYGVVQVAVTTKGSRIANVSFVQLTAFDGRSQEINSQAAPILLQETVAAQSAQIDTVSGATYTTDGYLQSLQSALDQAGIK